MADKDLLTTIRRDYDQGVLLESSLPSTPLELLSQWLDHAITLKLPDPNAMALATTDAQGFPTSRIVLLRDAQTDGLSFFTNYTSAKGKQLEKQDKASALFFWSSIERQIRVRGTIDKLSAADSDRYFATRPRDSQIGAWASPQSSVIAGRSELDDLFAKTAAKFANTESIPRPPHWGGYRLVPNLYEFWQGRPSRLHDRIQCELVQGSWRWQRLAP